MAMIELGDFACHISKELKQYWEKNNLAVLKKTNLDKVYIVDGGEGLGKSTFVFQQAAHLDPEMFDSPEKFVSRVAFTPEQFMELVRTVKNGVIIFDEAFRGFSSRAALSKINKRLVQALMEMRQNNNIVFIVLPSIFLLDIYPAMLRSQGLFNIYADKRSGKRVWQGYNKYDKNAIYQVGIKKGWRYFKQSKFRGNFYSKFPIGPEYEKQYLKKKDKVFREEEKNSPEAIKINKKNSEQALKHFVITYKNENDLSARKMEKYMKKNLNYSIDHSTISKWENDYITAQYHP